MEQNKGYGRNTPLSGHPSYGLMRTIRGTLAPGNTPLSGQPKWASSCQHNQGASCWYCRNTYLLQQQSCSVCGKGRTMISGAGLPYCAPCYVQVRYGQNAIAAAFTAFNSPPPPGKELCKYWAAELDASISLTCYKDSRRFWTRYADWVISAGEWRIFWAGAVGPVFSVWALIFGIIFLIGAF